MGRGMHKALGLIVGFDFLSKSSRVIGLKHHVDTNVALEVI